jgi:hypothetical protein
MKVYSAPLTLGRGGVALTTHVAGRVGRFCEEGPSGLVLAGLHGLLTVPV